MRECVNICVSSIATFIIGIALSCNNEIVLAFLKTCYLTAYWNSANRDATGL